MILQDTNSQNPPVPEAAQPAPVTSPETRATAADQTIPAEPEPIPQTESPAPVESPPPPEIRPQVEPQSAVQPQAATSDFRTKVREAKKKKYEANLEKIMKHAREKGKITNDDVQKLLHCSDATATRLAKVLIARGLLKRSGRTRGSFYEPV